MLATPKSIPSSPGVYFFLDKRKKPLYIGKASNLKNRLGSYFHGHKDSRIREMLQQAHSVTWKILGSEIEALIVESGLIKTHRPAFNILMRDDKQYFYVVFSNDAFPRVYLTHQPDTREHQTTIGPFTSGNALKTALKLLRKVFPYCSCSQKHDRYCLNYHIGKCLGFCCLKDTSNLSRKSISTYNKHIKALRDILASKRNKLEKQLEKEIFKDIKQANVEHAFIIRNQLEKLRKVFENAAIIRGIEKGSEALIDLQDILQLKTVPARIEGYDIAHIQGVYATGAMVVFEDGQPNKNEYRKFKIKGKATPNDTAMLHEIITRRLKHSEWQLPDLILIDGGIAQLNIALKTLDHYGLTIPVVSLTKDERHTGKHILSSHNKGKTAIRLTDMSRAARDLVLTVDEEAHRFAISYYRKLHRKID